MSETTTKPDEKIDYRERKLSENSLSDNETTYDPQFKPIIQLPEVEVKTNEENERALLKIRAKLFRFDKTEQPYEWKERGVGELKILQNETNNSVRIVMRRDKTFKVCANHFITPWIVLKPFANNEKAFLYTVPADFADEQPKTECLAIKFATIDNANLFKTKFDEAKDIVKTKCKLYNGECDKENFDDSCSNNSSDNDDSSDDDENVVTKEQEIVGKLSELTVKNDDKKNP